MCLSKPKIPDPKLPPQPIEEQKPANLELGGDKNKSPIKSRRKLRITRDTAGAQASSSVGAGGGVSIPGA